jgi:biotin carboxylase
VVGYVDDLGDLRDRVEDRDLDPLRQGDGREAAPLAPAREHQVRDGTFDCHQIGTAPVRGDGGVDLLVEHGHDRSGDVTDELGVGVRAPRRLDGRRRRPVRVLHHHARTAEVEGRTAKGISAPGGDHHRQIVVTLHDIVGTSFRERTQLHPVGVRTTRLTRDLDEEREVIGFGLRGTDLEDLGAGLICDVEDRHGHTPGRDHDTSVPTVVLLVPTSTYRAADFIAAARAVGAAIIVASDERTPAADPGGARSLAIPLDDPEAAAAAIVALDRRQGVDAVVAVDDRGIVAAALASEALGIPHNPPVAAARTRDKRALRAALDVAEVPQPRFESIDHPSKAGDAAARIGFPVVVKPVALSGSQGVIRADDHDGATAAAERAARIAGDGHLLVEEFLPGREVALEGLLRHGNLTTLAVFDKPDPLDGPFFEETIYVTPSRRSAAAIAEVERITADAAEAIGLSEGPVHAELRVDGDRVRVVEVAARSIGGLCARTLRFGAGISLEEVILRHALGMSLDEMERERAASGVMMLPIPRAGTLVAVRGQDAARGVDGIVGLEITIHAGRRLVPLPEGDRYLGFLFARGPTPEDVERSLRAAHGQLDIVVS